MQKTQSKILPVNWGLILAESANGDGRPLPQRLQKNDQIRPANATRSDEQQQIRRLQRELREAQMDRMAEATRYIKEGWLYLTGTPERAILDLADRKVIGWSLGDSLKATDTSIVAWRMALKNRAIDGSLIFHRSGDPIQDAQERVGQPRSF